MANFDVYMNLVGTTAKLQNSRGGAIGLVTLEYGDTLTVHPGSGFNGTLSLTKFEIFNWVNGTKGSSVGSWTGTTTNVGVLSVAASGSNVVATDNDRGSADADYGYSVTLRATRNGAHTDYLADPELMAKRRPGGNRDAMRATAKRRPPEAAV